jgi:hypothetical protein
MQSISLLISTCWISETILNLWCHQSRRKCSEDQEFNSIISTSLFSTSCDWLELMFLYRPLPTVSICHCYFWLQNSVLISEITQLVSIIQARCINRSCCVEHTFAGWVQWFIFSCVWMAVDGNWIYWTPTDCWSHYKYRPLQLPLLYYLYLFFLIATCFGHLDHHQAIYTVITKLSNCTSDLVF